jgi:UDP-N-acetylenolpyruvoylglucosamine reductase
LIDESARKTAAQCRHYAMCKIDYLETGLCPSGPLKHFVAYYPQGRMDLYRALAEGLIPVTEALLDSADTCTLCGVCDKQCHFVTGMRPVKVMEALKAFVQEHRAGNKPVLKPAADDILKKLRAIVGQEWASNDPAILFTYADDPFPLTGIRMPRYVVLPGSRDEVAAAVSLADTLGLPFAVRGNGGSVFGCVFSDGIVLDMNRMREIEFDAGNWCVSVGPGVTSFELQKEAHARGYRVNTAEPAATVCGNIVCTGTFSTWSNVYGTAADGFVDLEFVDRKGKVFRLSDRNAPNAFAFDHAVVPSPGVCTRAVVKLQPVTDDEEGLLVPFAELEPAVRFARELSQRRIALALAVLGGHYISTFMSPSRELSEKIKHVVPEVLGIQYLVLVVADAHGRAAVRKMAGTVIDGDLFRTLMLGLPRLADREVLDIVRASEGRTPPYEVLCRPEMRSVVEAILRPSPETIAGSVDEDLRDFYRRLYERPEMSDLVWLNMFRIVSARMARHKHVFAFLVYVPLDRFEVIDQVIAGLDRAGRAHGLEHEYGFLTPMDLGKRAILEYDFYLDHTDPAEKRKMAEAWAEIGPWLDGLAAVTKGVTFLLYVFSQGSARKESFLYRRDHGPEGRR